MRVGLFGGTFDPVHYGHLLLAEQCREQCVLDEVWFLPSGLPPHKQQAPITDGKHRVEMLQLAIAGHPAFHVNDMELHRHGPTYTVDTLTTLTAEHPDCEWFFLIGGDSLRDLPNWRQPQRIAELAQLVAVNRGRETLPPFDQLAEMLGPETAARIETVTMPAVDLSATDIRHRVHHGRSIRYMTPRAVEVYIGQHRLYVPAGNEPDENDAHKESSSL